MMCDEINEQIRYIVPVTVNENERELIRLNTGCDD